VLSKEHTPSHPHLVAADADPISYAENTLHHHISHSKNHYQDAFSFQKNFPDDPATQVNALHMTVVLLYSQILQDFVPKLKDHLLTRLLGQEYNGDEQKYSDADRNTVRLLNNRIYTVKVCQANFTTYDVRRDQDCLNPDTYADVMMLSRETDPNAHPYWYARILGVFHADVLHTGPHSKHYHSSMSNSYGCVGSEQFLVTVLA
jgi:hypothetical protein